MKAASFRAWFRRHVLPISMACAIATFLALPSAVAFAAYAPAPTTLNTTASYITGLATGPDGNLWYSSRAGGKIGKITPGGTVTEYSPPSSDDTPSLTVGPDGNIWFVEFNGNKVGKITTSGVITEYSIPTGGAMPYVITVGSDGNLWFLENNSNKIGKITTSGTITEYAIPTVNSNPQGLALGPDGNIWFTETTGRKIGKITPSGTITEYSLGGVEPTAIAAGADGNLWFTTYTTKVGKITTDGTATFYTTSHSSSGIALGPDDLIWFTFVAGSTQIGTVTPSGTVNEYALSGDPYTLDMIKGADDNLYFAVYEDPGKVLKLALPAKPGLPATKNITAISGKTAHIDVLSGISGNPDIATLSIVTPPTHGIAIVNTITYTPTAGYTGSDSLVYRVCSSDYSAMCAQGTLAFSVIADAPNTGFANSDTRSNTLQLLLIATGCFIASLGLRHYSRRYANKTY